MKCENCGAEMKELFSSFYCPHDCEEEGEYVIVYYRSLPWEDDEERGLVPDNGAGVWNFSKKKYGDEYGYKVSREDIISESSGLFGIRAGAKYEKID